MQAAQHLAHRRGGASRYQNSVAGAAKPCCCACCACRDHSVQDGLDYVATWNAGQVRSADLREVFAAKVQRRPPTFSKL